MAEISGFSMDALNDLRYALRRDERQVTPERPEPVSVSVVVNLQPVVDAIEGLSAQLEDLANAMRRPGRTAADEKLENAIVAAQYRWWDDCRSEALASIELHKLHARPHLLAAVACLHLGNTIEAVVHLENAVRYGSAQDPAAGAASALVAVHVLEAAGSPDEAGRVLRIALAAYPTCPQVVIAAAARAEDPADLPDGWQHLLAGCEWLPEQPPLYTAWCEAKVDEIRCATAPLVDAARDLGLRLRLTVVRETQPHIRLRREVEGAFETLTVILDQCNRNGELVLGRLVADARVGIEALRRATSPRPIIQIALPELPVGVLNRREASY